MNRVVSSLCAVVRPHLTSALSLIALFTLLGVPALAQTYMFNRADYATGQGPETVAVGDFNGDGRMDIVTGNTNSSSDTVSVLLGKADGTFAPAVDYAAGGTPLGVAVGDFNGDGKLDIAVLYGSGSTVSVLLGKGDGTFKPFVSTTAGVSGQSIAVGDFNGDGKLDVAISDNESSTPGVDVMLGKGTGTFNAAVPYATASDPRQVVVADFNGDGKLDLATVNSGSESVSVLLGTGSGKFGAHVEYSTSQPGCITLAAGDLRNDGKVDIVAGCQSNGVLEAFLGNGDGTFSTKPKTYKVPAGVDKIVAADFNGDGKLDVAATNGSSSGMVSVLEGSGTGTLKTAVAFGTNFGPTALAAADFNGDGRTDLVTANSGSPFGITIGNVSVLLSNGTKLLAARTDYKLTTIATSGAYSGIAAGDLNGDGKPDLVVPVTFANQISVLINSGSGSFKPFATYALPTNPDAVALGDFNNDSKMDVAIANFGGSGSISILLNSGTGTFPAFTQYNTNGYGYGIAVADFNKDGNQDIVVTDINAKTVSVLLGNGTGAFPTFATYATGNLPYAVAVGDFNGDGWPDLAVTNQGDGTVSILLNKADGSGTFKPQVAYTVGGNVLSVAVGSFRGDGVLDLAIATDNAFGGIEVLLGNNDGTFKTAVPYDTLNNAYVVTAGDFNNDGKIDLAVGINGGGSFGFITLLPGNGDGTFGPEVTLTSGTTPSGIVAADFNKDGGLDLANSNGSQVGDLGTATVILNEPVIALLPSSLAFGSEKVGTTSASKEVTVSNPGATPLKITSITISADFAETNTCPKTLDAGANCTVNVTFTPTATGAQAGTLSIKDSSLTSVQKIALTGTGT